MADFADRLRLYRTMHDMSLEDLAVKLHTQKQVLSRYELRQQIPKLDTVEKYAQIMNVEIPWLIGYDDGHTASEAKNKLCKIVDGLTEDQINAIITVVVQMTPPPIYSKQHSII